MSASNSQTNDLPNPEIRQLFNELEWYRKKIIGSDDKGREWSDHFLEELNDLARHVQRLEKQAAPSGPAEGVSELARHWAAVDLVKATEKGWPTDCIHLAREVLRLSQAQPEAGAERAAALREAAKIARDSYPKESDYDPRFKIAAHSIAGTLERMASSDATSEGGK